MGLGRGTRGPQNADLHFFFFLTNGMLQVIPFIIKNVLKSTSFNYMQAATTHIYFLNTININFFFFCYFI